MKLSYRDKVIFICAIVAIILVAGFFLFIKPKYDEMTVAKSYLQDKESEKAKIEEKIGTLSDLVEQVKETAKTVDEIQERFFVYQDPYLTEQVIYDIIEETGLEVMGMTTPYVVPGEVENYTISIENIETYELLMQGDLYNELPQEVQDVYNKASGTAIVNQVVGITELDINYKDDAELEKVVQLMDAFAEDDRTVRVKNYYRTYDVDSTVDKIQGTINLELYHIFPLNVEKVMEETDEVEIVPAEQAAAE
ncbi:MAG: hypothetical protein IJZ72_04150 [Oscillospiraceae bacterium]|nr:hypothetical protein [Oscillospiraceae bacterium]